MWSGWSLNDSGSPTLLWNWPAECIIRRSASDSGGNCWDYPSSTSDCLYICLEPVMSESVLRACDEEQRMKVFCLFKSRACWTTFTSERSRECGTPRPTFPPDGVNSAGNEESTVVDFTDPQKTCMIYKARRTRANDTFPPSESSSFSLNPISDISLTFRATNYKSRGGSGGIQAYAKHVRLLIKGGKALYWLKCNRLTDSACQWGGSLQMISSYMRLNWSFGLLRGAKSGVVVSSLGADLVTLTN